MSAGAPAGDDLAALAKQALDQLNQGQGPEALRLYSHILERWIDCAPAFHGAGLALTLMGDDAGAEASHRHAAALAPYAADPLAALAQLALRGRDPAAARAHAHRALALDPRSVTASLTLAQLDLDDGGAEAVLARLAPILQRGASDPLQGALAHRLAAESCERLGRVDQAFAAWAVSAAVFRSHYAASCGGPTPLPGLDLARRLVEGYADAGPRLWRSPSPVAARAPDAARHVFVVGFPRSGTTLLEQVLASHPAVTALEEQTTLMPAIDAFLDPPAGIETLADLSEAQAEYWRGVYWARVRAFGVAPEGKVFVDKQPFYTLWLPLIAKLFPEARIIIARRDPRDVVWSCYRNPFRMTPVTYELQDLARASGLYDATMRVAAQFEAHSALARFAYRHEDLVADFDGTAKALCAFLGLDWADTLRDFAETAKRRAIRTPSAAQVVQGLNARGVGAWRPYAAHLGPMIEAVAPWTDAFGYAP